MVEDEAFLAEDSGVRFPLAAFGLLFFGVLI